MTQKASLASFKQTPQESIQDKERNEKIPIVDNSESIYIQEIETITTEIEIREEEEEEDEEEEDEEEEESAPPDGGYGWVIVFGCFITHVSVGIIGRGSGIFLLEFLNRFEKSNKLTAMPLSLVSAIFLCLGPVTSALCNKYSTRATVMVGGVMMCIGMIATAFVDEFYLLFVTFSLITGLGLALCYAPSLIIVNMYFDKHRSIANGIGSSGVGVGSFLFVPLMQNLFDTYGYSYAFFIMGAFMLNMSVVAMLFRPLRHHSRAQTDMYQSDVEFFSDPNSLAGSKIHSSVDVSKRAHVSHKAKHKHPHKANPTSSQSSKSSRLKAAVQLLFPVDNRDKKDKQNKLFDFSLLKNGPFFLYCISICLFTLAFKSAFIFLPALCQLHGLSEVEAAEVLSISGIFDTLGRLLTGFLLDSDCLRRHRILVYNGFMFVVGAMLICIPFCYNFWQFVLVSCVYAYFTGAYICQKSVIVVDVLGIQNMAKSFGLLISFQGIGTIVGPPLSGLLKDTLGDYDKAFFFGGICTFAASILMVMCIILLRIKSKSNNTKHNQPETHV